MKGRSARVLVVGAGVTGLTTAHRLLRDAQAGAAPDVTVLEASGRAGGMLQHVEVAGLPLEAGPDSFVVRKPWAVDLCRELGLEAELIRPGTSGAFVWTRGRLVPYPEQAAFGIPSDAESLLRWPGLSARGRLRAAFDLYRKAARSEQDESVGSLVARRMGRECAEVLVGPLLAGIHAGDPDRLSVRATFPELVEWERAYGSLIRGARAARRAARERGGGAMFASIDGGLQRLIVALAEAVGAERVRLEAPVSAVRRATGGEGYEVDIGGELLPADAVVLAVPAFESAKLLSGLSPSAAAALEGIRYTSTATVALVYPSGTAERLPDATGFIVAPARTPANRRTITACTWLSRKWPDPRFGTRAVVRAFVGRDGEQDALGLEDEELAVAVARDVEAVSPVGVEPESWAVVRWQRAMPQYDVGHLEQVADVERALAADAPGVFVTGSAYRGMGIADCVRQAGEAADLVRAHMERSAPAPNDDEGDRTEAVSWTK